MQKNNKNKYKKYKTESCCLRQFAIRPTFSMKAGY